MSGTESADEDSRTVTAEEDGVRIEKSLTLEEFDTPAIVFTVESDRDAVTYLKITDPLPEEIDPDDVGLHPEYDSEGWRRRGGDLQFEGRLAPDEEIETVYGLRVANVDQPAALLAAPEIDEVVDATDDGEDDTSLDLDIGDDEDDDGIDLAINDEDDAGDEDAGAESDADTDTDTGEASTDDADPTSDTTEASTGDDGTGTDDGADADAGTGGLAVEADTVAAALVAELERGRVDDETRAALNEHLQPTLPTSAETRLDRVQARLDDLEAYTEALERILDRVGDDDDVVSELESLRSEVADLERRTDDLSDDVAFNDARLEPLADLDEDVATLREDLDDLEDDLAGVREDLSEDIEEDLAEIREEIEDIQEWRETLASTIAGGE